MIRLSQRPRILNMFRIVSVTGLVLTVSALCPHERPELRRWSDEDTWISSTKPEMGGSVFITEPILLDQSPIDLYNITIETGGSLVADPETDVVLRAANIFVEGTFEIGSKTCPFDGELNIILTGTRESHEGETEQKVILVQNGGTLEIHGKSKLPWTKISATVAPPSPDDTYFEHKLSDNEAIDAWKRGLSAYTFTVDSNGRPQVKQYGIYDLVINGDVFASHMNNVADDDIVMITTQRFIRQDDLNDRTEQWAAYDALETLLYGMITNAGTLRSVPDDGTTYALIYQKGNPASFVETTKPLGEGLSIYFIWNQQTVYTATTGSGPTYYYHLDNFLVTSLDAAFPLLNVIDDVSTWMQGDTVIVTSTDYDWRQVEERTVAKCDSCTTHQLRVDASFEYTHFGELIKGDSIDMRAEVALLTRNIVIEGEMEDTCPHSNGNCDERQVHNRDTFGAHVKVLSGYVRVHIEGVELRHVGQHTDLGRYPLHFHMCLDPPDPSDLPYIKEVSIHHSFARCITIHGSHDVQLLDNVCYDHMGHGFFLEDGSEMRTVFDGNLGIGARKGTGFLEPTDNVPASFWITNPNTKFVNNFAAGGDGTGIWFLYPDEPMGPSKDLGVMELYEARNSPIKELTNNVAHSNVNTGIMFGNRLNADRTRTCCSLWQPREDPKNSTSAPIEVSISRLTAYKNRRLNIWAEGGLINVSHISVADSISGIMVHNDRMVDKFAGRLTKAVVVDNSDNIGEAEDGDDRSMPMYWDREAPHMGVTMWFGPVKYSDIWFDGFENNDLYDTGAIGLKRDSPYVFSLTTQFSGLQYAFDDGTSGRLGCSRVCPYLHHFRKTAVVKCVSLVASSTTKRSQYPMLLLEMCPGRDVHVVRRSAGDTGLEIGLSNLAITGTFGENPGWPNEDGLKVTGFTWFQDTDVGVEKYYVVKPDHFSAAADDCKVRTNWRLALCETKYGNIKLRLGGKDRDNNEGVVYVRDDLPSAQLTFDMEFTIGPQVVLDGSHTYTLHFLGEIAREVLITGEGMGIGDVLRVGICIPRDADFRMSSYYPHRLHNANYFTRVSSLDELDAESEQLDGKKYFRDETTGMLYYKFWTNKSRSADDWNSCADGKCPQLKIRVYSGTFNDADCRDRIYGDQQLMTQPTLMTFDEVLPANGGDTPPEGWGAGVTRPFASRVSVNGAFGNWTIWSECTVTCGDGIQTRNRKCDSPRPANGGAGCEGHTTEELSCFIRFCPIDGGLTPWEQWEPCLIMDGCEGYSERNRACSNPEPQHGGHYCTGYTKEVQPCKDC